jgi:low affinity Fe/Cu permease
VGIPNSHPHHRSMARFRTFLSLLGTWQLIINTGTKVVTFLVVFLIQNTQNRDARAIHLKLDQIIKSIDQAHNKMIDIEHLSDEELQKLSNKFQKVREECDNRSKRSRT